MKVRGAYTSLYRSLILQKIATNIPAVMEVGIKVAIIDARDVDPDPFESYDVRKQHFPN